MKKGFLMLAAALLALPLLLSGCMLSASAENLYAPPQLPAEYEGIREKEGIQRAVVDYIAGMSDRYCIATFEDIFVPRPWTR